MIAQYLDIRRRDIRLGGGAYFLAGFLLFLLKFSLDWSVAHFIHHRPWSMFSYLARGPVAAAFVAPADPDFYVSLLIVAAPFVWIGLTLTVFRLRTVALPLWLALLFFIPFVNVIFFIVLSAYRSMDEATDEFWTAGGGNPIAPEIPIARRAQPMDLQYGRDQANRFHSALARLIPEESGRARIVAVLVSQPIALGLTLLATLVLGNYGVGLFVGLPFLLAMLSVLIHGYRTQRTIRQSLWTAMLAIFTFSLCMLLFMIEGIVCIVMALPLALVVAIPGALLGHALQCGRRPDPEFFAIVVLAMPLLLGAERALLPEAPLFEVTSCVDVDAPPAVVWRHVVTFDPLPPPTELIFRAGVAHPQRAEIIGTGVGATRRCTFSTGAFVEPITVWDEPKLLKFDVTENPRPMDEWSLYGSVHPPHLEGFLVSKGGQFHLVELPGGRTRLEGTTWYHHHMWPAGYWRLWSDQIIHTIHLRVLNHVKSLSEREAG